MNEVILSHILEELNTLIMVLDDDGNVTYINESAERLLGYNQNDLLGNGWWQLTRSNMHQANYDRQILLEAVTDLKDLSFSRKVLSKDGSQRIIDWKIKKNGTSIVAIGNDVTVKENYKLEIEQNNKKLLASNLHTRSLNQEIHDSISYAYRIQQSVLPSLNGLQEIAPNSFILFKPKDIVSGDFYWYHQKDNKLFIAAVDCTGHGVPGAMMSIIGLNLFKDIIVKRGIEDPGTILKTIDYELDNTLNHDQTSTKTKDGMDVSLIVVDTENTTLQFAGAFRPLLVVSGESRVEYKGSRYPIGFFDLENKVFETQDIEVKKGDRLYLYSDGYNDQFGGERNKKLTRSRFYQFLETSELMDMEEQGSYLDYSIQNWKQNEPQTDDILVIGVEL